MRLPNKIVSERVATHRDIREWRTQEHVEPLLVEENSRPFDYARFRGARAYE